MTFRIEDILISRRDSTQVEIVAILMLHTCGKLSRKTFGPHLYLGGKIRPAHPRKERIANNRARGRWVVYQILAARSGFQTAQKPPTIYASCEASGESDQFRMSMNIARVLVVIFHSVGAPNCGFGEVALG